jgi:hypothetical protein
VPMASTIPAAYLGTTTAGVITADWDAAAYMLRISDVTVADEPDCDLVRAQTELATPKLDGMRNRAKAGG